MKHKEPAPAKCCCSGDVVPQIMELRECRFAGDGDEITVSNTPGFDGRYKFVGTEPDGVRRFIRVAR